MKVTKTVINGIEYSRENSEHVFLVSKSKLGSYKASELPHNSSLHVTEIEDFDGVDLYFFVTNGNAPGYTLIAIISFYFFQLIPKIIRKAIER